MFEVDGVDHSVEFPKKKVIVEHIRNNPPGSIQTLVRGISNQIQHSKTQQHYKSLMKN